MAPLVCQVAPRKGVAEGYAIVVAPPVTQTHTMVGVTLDRQPQPTAYPLGMGLGAPGMEAITRVTRGLVQGGRVWPIIGIQMLSNALDARGGATWPGNALPQHQL